MTTTKNCAVAGARARVRRRHCARSRDGVHRERGRQPLRPRLFPSRRARRRGAKKGNNWLAGLGFAFTPVDERAKTISLQLGLATEVHDPDVLGGANTTSGGWEVFASPTIVRMPAARTRFFTYVSVPVAQDDKADYQVDRWRAGLGVIYSFDRAHDVPVVGPPSRVN